MLVENTNVDINQVFKNDNEREIIVNHNLVSKALHYDFSNSNP